MTIKNQGGIFGRNPTFNDLTVEGSLSVPADSITGDAINGGNASLDSLLVDTDTLVVDAANNRVGIANSTPSFTLDAGGRSRVRGAGGYLFDVEENGANATRLQLYIDGNEVGVISGADGTVKPINFYLSGKKIEFTTAGNIKFTNSGSGIDFSATAGTGTSELFDDYEEGTFTPTWTGLTTSGTETTNEGFYTKVGRMVYYSTFLQYSTSFDTTQGTTHHTLPFTPFKSGANFASNESNAANVYTGTGLIFSGSSLSYVPTVSAGNTMIVFSGTYMAV